MDPAEFRRQLEKYTVVRPRGWIESDAERRRRGRSGPTPLPTAAGTPATAAARGGAGGDGSESPEPAAAAAAATGAATATAAAAAVPTKSAPLTVAEAAAYTDFWAGLRMVLAGALGAERGAAVAAAYEDRHYAVLKSLTYEDIEELCRYIETTVPVPVTPTSAGAAEHVPEPAAAATVA